METKDILKPKVKTLRPFAAVVKNTTLKLAFHAAIFKNVGTTNVSIDGNYVLVPGEVLQIAESDDVIVTSMAIAFGQVNVGLPATTPVQNRLEYFLIEIDGSNPLYSGLNVTNSTNNTNGGSTSATGLPNLF